MVNKNSPNKIKASNSLYVVSLKLVCGMFDKFVCLEHCNTNINANIEAICVYCAKDEKSCFIKVRRCKHEHKYWIFFVKKQPQDGKVIFLSNARLISIKIFPNLPATLL